MDTGKYDHTCCEVVVLYSSFVFESMNFLRLYWFASLLILSCGPSEKKPQSESPRAPEIPMAESDVIVARLAPYLIAAAEKQSEKEINTILDLAMEQGWDLEYMEPGILYHILADGQGSYPKWGDYISTHYVGANLTGKIFDSSRARDKPMNFYVGNVITGWNEVLQSVLKPGGRGLFLIPAHLAYGDKGFRTYVAPGEHLLFDLELLDILPDPNAN